MEQPDDTSPFIAWSAALSVGIEVFDREHRAMIDAVNRVYAACLEASEEHFIAAVDALIATAEEHFAHEEEVLRTHGCAGIEVHVREHEELLEDVTALRLLGNDTGSGEQVMVMLREWLREHILNLDHGYRDCLAGKEIT